MGATSDRHIVVARIRRSCTAGMRRLPALPINPGRPGTPHFGPGDGGAGTASGTHGAGAHSAGAAMSDESLRGKGPPTLR